MGPQGKHNVPKRVTSGDDSHRSWSIPDVIGKHRYRLVRHMQWIRGRAVNISKGCEVLGVWPVVAVQGSYYDIQGVYALLFYISLKFATGVGDIPALTSNFFRS